MAVELAKLIKAELSDLEQIIELRQDVLHPGGPRERVVYKQDREVSTVHLISKDVDGILQAVGTLVYEFEREPENDLEDSTVDDELRIRGMAVRESLRGQGVGSQIVERFISLAKEAGVKKIWCNARTAALPLYERKGFVTTGDPFDVPGSGPHYRLRRFL